MSGANPKLLLIEHPARFFKKDLRTHYPGSKGVIGQNIFYGIYLGFQRLGVIAVAPTTFPMKSVIKEVYGKDKMTKEVKHNYGKEIVSNLIFRLYEEQPNLASRILSLFIKKVYVDWHKKFEVFCKDEKCQKDHHLRGIISLTFGLNERSVERTGIAYKAANWTYMGLSSGGKKVWVDGHYGGKKSKPKHVWLWKYKEFHGKKSRPSNLDTSPQEELRLDVPIGETEAPTVERFDDNSKPTGVES